MTDRFIPLEIFSTNQLNNLPSSMNFNTYSNGLRYYKVELFRLLIGVSSFRCDFSTKIIKQRYNYHSIPYKFNKNLNPKIGRVINSDTSFLLKKLSNQINRVFYDEVLKEFYSYFYELELNNHTICFLHLYRILERISICLPLVYAGKTPDYSGVYKKLREFINDQKTGELKVIDIFIKSFIDSTILNSNVDIEFSPLQNNWHINHYKSIEKFNLHDSATPNSTLTFKYKNLIDLIVKIRNSYFHSLTGADNSYKSKDVIVSSEFFKTVNPIFCNWLSFMIIEILKYEST